VVIVGQIVSAGGMALQMGLPVREALTVGVGMCGRAELAFILASLALAQGAIGQPIFSVLIFTAFLLNLFTPLALKGCAVLLGGRAARQEGATRGVLQVDKFTPPFSQERFEGLLPHALPNLEGGVVIYGYGPEVESLMSELESRGLPTVVIEENEAVARRLHGRGQPVVHATLAEKELDLGPLARARVLVANGEDDDNAVFTLEAREQGFGGPIIALVRNPHRREPMLLAGATATFTPAHVLAAALAARASTKISPRVAGVQPLGRHLEVVELRVHSASPLANLTLAKAGIRARTGANIVGQWFGDMLRSPPAADEELKPDTILVAVGSPDSIRRLREMARPITQAGRLIVAGLGEVGQPLTQYLADAGEDVCVIDIAERPGIDVVGDVLDRSVLDRASVADARAVILALGSDSTTQFAATVIRSYAPDLPIFASVMLRENVGRIQKAGVDFAISVSQVAGQLLAHHVLGETVSLQARIKVVKTRPGPLEGKTPLAARIRERTGCSVVAVERGDQILMDFPPSFTLSADDAIYICGTTKAVGLYYDQYPASRL
jgi:Trk K+ transport system NAD-binding subunit